MTVNNINNKIIINNILLAKRYLSLQVVEGWGVFRGVLGAVFQQLLNKVR